MRAYANVIEEYVDELGFLTIQRRRLLFAPDVELPQLRTHDDRIEAHLDGLRHAGDEAMPVISERLTSDDPWEVFAAARAWLEIAAPGADELFEHIERATEDQLPGWLEALRVGAKQVSYRRASPKALVVIIGAGPWWEPPSIDPAEEAAYAESPAMRRAAARALGAAPAGRASVRRARLLLEKLLEDPDPAIRDSALWGACLLDPAAALPRLRSEVTGRKNAFALRACGLLGDESDLRPMIRAAERTKGTLRAAALRGLGHLGFSDALPTIFDALAGDDIEANAAAEAYFTLVGVEAPVIQPAEPPTPETDASMDQDEEEPEEVPQRWDIDAARAAAPTSSQRLLRGRPMQQGDDMERLWRRALLQPSESFLWLRREVPDGFFSAAPADDARPGE